MTLLVLNDANVNWPCCRNVKMVKHAFHAILGPGTLVIAPILQIPTRTIVIRRISKASAHVHPHPHPPLLSLKSQLPKSRQPCLWTQTAQPIWIPLNSHSLIRQFRLKVGQRTQFPRRLRIRERHRSNRNLPFLIRA